jgi:hypothetical protein
LQICADMLTWRSENRPHQSKVPTASKAPYAGVRPGNRRLPSPAKVTSPGVRHKSAKIGHLTHSPETHPEVRQQAAPPAIDRLFPLQSPDNPFGDGLIQYASAREVVPKPKKTNSQRTDRGISCGRIDDPGDLDEQVESQQQHAGLPAAEGGRQWAADPERGPGPKHTFLKSSDREEMPDQKSPPADHLEEGTASKHAAWPAIEPGAQCAAAENVKPVSEVAVSWRSKSANFFDENDTSAVEIEDKVLLIPQPLSVPSTVGGTQRRHAGSPLPLTQCATADAPDLMTNRAISLRYKSGGKSCKERRISAEGLEHSVESRQRPVSVLGVEGGVRCERIAPAGRMAVPSLKRKVTQNSASEGPSREKRLRLPFALQPAASCPVQNTTVFQAAGEVASLKPLGERWSTGVAVAGLPGISIDVDQSGARGEKTN